MNEEEDFSFTFSDEDFERRYSSEETAARPPVLRRGNLGRSQASRLAAAIASCARCRAAAWPHPSPGCNCSSFIAGLVPVIHGTHQRREMGGTGGVDHGVKPNDDRTESQY
jgi:hypothetical protein